MDFVGAARYWWESEHDEISASLFSHVETLDSDQQEIIQSLHSLTSLYTGRGQFGGFNLKLTNQISNNITAQVIDTAASVIAKNKPKIRVLTSGARWSEQRTAKELENFVWAEFVRCKVYDIGPDIFRDAGVWGCGALKVFPRHNKVCAERVPITDILVDEKHCRSQAKPRELFHRRLYDRDEIIGMFPDHEALLEQSGARATNWADYVEIASNQVMVIEGWRLPTSPSSPGRHVIAVDNGCLVDEDWLHEDFPFAFFRWNRFDGFYGKGIAEEIADIQIRLYQLDRFIQKCQDLIAVPRVFVDGKIQKAHLNNEIGAIFPYRGNQPVFYTPQALNAEIYNQRKALIPEAFERIGLNQATAQAMVPVGVESAVAMREVAQRQDTRFAIQAQRYEQFYKDVAKLFITCARDLYKAGVKIRTRFESRNLVKTIDWKDVDLDEDRFSLSIEAASIFTMSPSARLDAVVSLAQTGIITPQEMRRLLNHPDLEQSEAIANADMYDCDRVIDLLLDGGFESPEPFQNLIFYIKRIQLAYLKAKSDGAPDEILESVRTWLAQAQGILESAQPPPQPQPRAPAMGANESTPVDAVQPSDDLGVA